MPKRRVEGYGQNQRRNGDLACKRSRPERRWKHLYLVLDDWEKGYSIHKIDLVSFDSDSDDNQESSRGCCCRAPPRASSCTVRVTRGRGHVVRHHGKQDLHCSPPWHLALPFLLICNVASTLLWLSMECSMHFHLQLVTNNTPLM